MKQNLNKPMSVLRLENDLSVMSIVRSRGRSEVLVLVGLEEMGIYDAGADPNMRDTCRLLSQRFSGR